MTGSSPAGYEPYRPRRVDFHGVRETRGFRLKLYSIRYAPGPVRWEHFERGLERAFEELPKPAVAEGRPGLGFAIAHQGRAAHYVMLCWWDRENELPSRLFVRGDSAWRRARGNESFCVWDLQVLWHERQAYVDTVLAPDRAGVEAYLARTLAGEF